MFVSPTYIGARRPEACLNASTKAAVPTLGEPKVMQRTSEVGLCSAAQQAAMVASEPPTQNPVISTRRGVLPPALPHTTLSDNTA